MLTPIEKVLFSIVALASITWTTITFRRMIRVVLRGRGRLNLEALPRRVLTGLIALVTHGGMLRRRTLTSCFHALVAWAFLFYVVVNVADLLEGFVHGFPFPGRGTLGNVYRLAADLLSAAAFLGTVFLMARRLVVRAADLTIHTNVKLHPDAASGIDHDSLLVGVFILGHVGFRLLGASVVLSQEGTDTWQPIAGIVSVLWTGQPESVLIFTRHVFWWLSLGLILIFVPYFPYTKHAHLFMGPFNWMTRPRRSSPGALDAIDFDDETIEQFGSSRLTDLSRTHIVDGLACIMCNRCQDVCPAYLTGKELSPSALEINKRYYLKRSMKDLAVGGEDRGVLLDYAISESAVWACLGCGACAEACPVGNEPMFDIFDIRRHQVLMEGRFPNELKAAYEGTERNGNPWQMTESRLSWAQALDFSVPTVEDNRDFDVLYWVGCAGAFDPRTQNTARAIATILHRSGVNFAVLGESETCTGDAARRFGNEYLFSKTAKANIETLHAVGADRREILTGCPHCLHTIGNEYPAYGGRFTVRHHTQFIDELVRSGRLEPRSAAAEDITFHDPCYLGRQNGEYDAPRRLLTEGGFAIREMGRRKKNAFCCGGGGAQMWKEEEEGTESVSDVRYAQARATGAETVAVGCPFCARMLGDANDRAGSKMHVQDVAELIADAIRPENS